MTTSSRKIDSFRGEYRWLSNFHEADVDTLGLTFRTNEAAYHSWKRVDDLDFHLKLQSFEKARDAMYFGRSLPIMTPYWHETAKFSVMYDLNLQKFSRHLDLREKLLATGDAHLEEGNNHGDRCWGTVNGEGRNHLGLTLMQVRTYLRLLE